VASEGQTPPKLRLRTRLWIVLLAALPWLFFFGVVGAAWWFLIFDGDPGTDGLGLVLLGLALPVLFATVAVSRWERRWLRVRFNLETAAASRRGGGEGLLDLLGW